MRKFYFSLIAIFLVICGCSPIGRINQTTVPIESEKTQLITISPSKTPLAHIESTIIPTVEAKINPTATPKVTQTSPFQQLEISSDALTCSPVATNENFETPGTILYQNYGDKGLYAAGGKNFMIVKKIISSEQTVFVFGVSPDGSTIAFSQIPNKNNKLEKAEPVIILLRADGKMVEHRLKMDWPKKVDQEDYELENFVDGYWLNKQLILGYIISKIPEDKSSSNTSAQIGNYLPILFDPFIGKVQTTLLEIFMPTNGQTTYNISPDLKRVLVYDYGSGLINLKEVAENGDLTNLWEMDLSIWNAFIPVKWSPNGEWAVFTVFDAGTVRNSFKTILLSKTGKALMIENPLFDGLVLTHLSWSPDSRYFAFVVPKNESSYDLYVFDNVNRKLVLNCPVTTIRPDASFEWSPDSTWIAMSTYEEPIRIININTGRYKDLDLSGNLAGWLDKFAVTP